MAVGNRRFLREEAVGSEEHTWKSGNIEVITLIIGAMPKKEYGNGTNTALERFFLLRSLCNATSPGFFGSFGTSSVMVPELKKKSTAKCTFLGARPASFFFTWLRNWWQQGVSFTLALLLWLRLCDYTVVPSRSCLVVVVSFVFLRRCHPKSTRRISTF